MTRTADRTIAKTKYLKRDFIRNWQIYLFLFPALLYLVIFCYMPMYGILIAFEDYKPRLGVIGSEWVGLKHFRFFFTLGAFQSILKNTLVLSIYSLFAGFPLPVLFALILNTCVLPKFKKAVQTITYAPHFISTVVLVGMINVLFAPSQGVVVNILYHLGFPTTSYLQILMKPDSFPHLYVWSGIWSNIGWNSIIYLSALSSVDPALHESAKVDGASKFQRLLYIDFPSILPTIVILLILNCGSIMSVGFEKAFLMQNGFNISMSEVISTYVYKTGIRNGQYSISTAIGLFNSVINFILLLLVNKISKIAGDNSLW
jgi:putative aldouronate transport system permease protein